jgi:hypothetical protein
VTAGVTITLEPAYFSIDSLIGVPVRFQSWRSTNGCNSPDMGAVVGEVQFSVVKLLRDGQGDILVGSGFNLATAGGVVFYGEALLPEIKLAWVDTPDNACQPATLELTTVATGKKTRATGGRDHVDIGGQGYLFVGSVAPLNGACAVNATWVLIRDGFLHPPRAGFLSLDGGHPVRDGG